MTTAPEIDTTAPDIGLTMYRWATDLFPICRSITGEGVRQTLGYLKSLLPGLEVHGMTSGTQAFDWTVPDEWNIRDAFVADESGHRIIDFRENNLHVVGYSEPVDARMTFRQLDAHLYHLPQQPDSIPYITSYYKKRWGFCLTHNQYEALRRDPDRVYHVRINATLEPGELNYAELFLPGESDSEVFFSTYVCHPSLANNELSGPCVQTALAQWIAERIPKRRLSYRFFFGPETIGPICYLSQHLDALREHMIAGFVLTCVGDQRAYSYLASRHGDTLADRMAQHVLRHKVGDFVAKSYLDRGSDERQYCWPGVDLPVCTLCRSMFGDYPEYHTSLDNLDLISADGMRGSLEMLQQIVMALEANRFPNATTLCEPQLGKRGLYPTLSTMSTRGSVATMMDLLAYSDGNRDLLGVADTIGAYIGDLIPVAERLTAASVLTYVNPPTQHHES